jgi:hypothetical protein
MRSRAAPTPLFRVTKPVKGWLPTRWDRARKEGPANPGVGKAGRGLVCRRRALVRCQIARRVGTSGGGENPVGVVVGGDGGANVGACVCEGFGGGHGCSPFCGVPWCAGWRWGCGQSGEGRRSTPKRPRGWVYRLAHGRLGCDPLLTVEGEWLPNPRPPSGGHPSAAPSAPTPTLREDRNEKWAPPRAGWRDCRRWLRMGGTENNPTWRSEVLRHHLPW